MKKILRPSAGHILDIDPSELAEQYLSRAHNVHTRKGFPSRINGRRVAYAALPNSPLHLLNLQLNTFNWWMSFGAGDIYAVEGSNTYNISIVDQLAVSDAHEWSSTLLNGIPVFSNGKNALSFWNGVGASAVVAVPDWPIGMICKAVVAFRFHLFALNIDETAGVFDNKIIWSDATEPGALPASWTPSASNEAGSAFCADTPGPCITGRPLAERLLIYKSTSIYGAEYIGQHPDRIFSVRPLLRSQGILGPHCVVDAGGGTQHLVAGNDDVILTDGLNTRSVADNRIKHALANTIDETYARNAFIVRDRNRKETWVCVPESGSQFATLAHIWDETRDTWTTRDLAAVRYGTTGYVTDESVNDTWDAATDTWDTVTRAWNQPSDGAVQRVVIAEEDAVYLEDTSHATAVTAYVAKHDLVFDDDTQNKLITRIWLQGTGLGFGDLQFRLGARQSTDESITWQAYLDPQEGGTPCEIRGRYISIEVRAIGDQIWTLNRIQFEGKYCGAY